MFKLVDNFEFIVTLVVTCSIFDYLLPVTRKRQAKDLDVAQLMDLIQNLKMTIENLRNSVENHHKNWYNKAKKLAEKVDISEDSITKPRTCSRQIYRSNQPVQNTKEYFRVSLTIPFLDHVSADLEHRFPGDELTQYRGLYIIPYVMLNESSDWKKNLWFLLIIIMTTFQILMALIQSWISGSIFGIVQNLKTTCLILFL